MNLSKTQCWTVGTVLLAMLVLTRSGHLGSTVDLPDASWALFFVAAFYLRALWAFPLFMLAAWLIDLSAIELGGVSAFCLTPAYFMLVPAYGVLWLAGSWYARVHRDRLSTLAPLLASFLLGVVFCELFSSGGFYLFSGYFETWSWVHYWDRTVAYFPAFLSTALLYLGLAACVHGLIYAGRDAAASGARQG